MLDKHLIFHLFVFRLSIVVAILESVSSDQTVVCHPAKGKSSCACLAHIKNVTLYNDNITVYKLAGSKIIVFAPNRSDVRLDKVGSSFYSWTVNDTFTYKWRERVKPSNEGRKLFYSRYKALRSTAITAKHDGVRLRYTAQLPNSTSFHSETATLRVGALPKISKSSTIHLGKLDSKVEACFNVTGIPKPLLKISNQDNNIVTTSANRKEKYCVFFDLQEVNAENITVTAENCFGNLSITIDIPKFQNALNTETSKSYNPTVSTSTDPSTRKSSSQSTAVSPHFTGASTKSTAEDKGNKTTTGFPTWAYAIISILIIATLILFAIFIIIYVRKRRQSKAASQEPKDDVLVESEPTVHAMSMKQRAVVSPFINESATVTADEQLSVVLGNKHTLDSSPTDKTECPLYSNVSEAETSAASRGVKPDEPDSLAETDGQATYATPYTKTTKANSHLEAEDDNTLTVTHKPSEGVYDVLAPNNTHSTACSPNTNHHDGAAVSSSLEYAELQFGNNPVGPVNPSSVTVTYASINTDL